MAGQVQFKKNTFKYAQIKALTLRKKMFYLALRLPIILENKRLQLQ